VKLFLSRDTESAKELILDLQKAGVEVEGESLIVHENIDFEVPSSDFGWVFFSSRRAVQFFVGKIDASNPFWLHKKVGCIGAATAQSAARSGIAVHFVGQGLNTAEVAKKFRDEVRSGKILFPIGNQSLRTVQRATVAIQKKIKSEAEFLLFTSPSNVRAYCANQNLEPAQTLLVLGGASAKTAQELGIENIKILAAMDAENILNAIKAKK